MIFVNITQFCCMLLFVDQTPLYTIDGEGISTRCTNKS